MNNGARELPAAVRDELIAIYNAAQWDRLVVAADNVTRRYPANALGWQAAGKAFLQLNKLPEAIEKLSRVIRIAPGNADAYNDLGNALHDVGRVDEAVASFRRALELNPRSPETLSNFGRILCGLGQYEEAAINCQRAIDLNPESAIAHNNLGNALGETGRPLEAEAAYRRSLALKPDYLDALINLGSLLAAQTRLEEAKATYRLAVRLHPNAGVAFNALGRFLSRLTGEDEEARQCLERAIALAAYDTNTFVELGNILMRQKRTDAALVMFRQAKTLQPLITWPANQPKAEFSAVFLDTPMGGSTPVNYLAGKAKYDRHFHCVLPDTPDDVALLRSKADVVFNMICNADDGGEVLAQAADLVDRMGRPTINHPRTILRTDRESIARRFADIPRCVIPNTLRIAGMALIEAASRGELAEFRLPLLVRVAGPHGGEDFGKFESWRDIADFVAGAPEQIYYVIEFINYRSADGFFRKYRVIFVDGEILPYHLAIHDDWKVHHFRTDMANHEWMRREEERFLENIGGVFDAAHQDALRAMAGATGLDYGGIDCGLDRDGRIVVFEANASMLVHDEKNQQFAYKNPYVARIKTAFDAMMSRRRLTG
jgi:tetratricopeptide (TPR) repeat protein/glutathione synthase/RimK-type ligase-like ATP-grasp enzyme